MSAPASHDEQLISELAASMRERDLQSATEQDLLGAPNQAETRAIADAVLSRLGIAEPAVAAAPVVPIRRPTRRLRSPWLGGAALAAAAAMLLWMVPGAPRGSDAHYRLELPPGQSALRDTPASSGVPAYAKGRSLRLRLIPNVRTEAALSLAAFLQIEQTIIRLPATLERFEGGVLEANVQLEAPVQTETTAKLVVLLAPNSESLEAASVTSERLPENVQRMISEVRIVNGAR